MFNSQKINNDPEPYIGWSGRRYDEHSSTWASLEDGPVAIEPRPEYDNNPNPILERFRRYKSRYPRLTLKTGAEEFLWILDGGFMLDKWEYQEDHLDHAKKVLEKLVNVYGN